MMQRRAGTVVVLGAATLAATSLAGLEPRPIAVVLVVAMAVVALGLLNDATIASLAVWYPPVTHRSLTRGRDVTTLAHARQIENHLTSRQPDDAVRSRLAAIADQVLHTRHGVALHSALGRQLLGPEVDDVLTGPVRRLSLPTIEQCLRTIEEL